MVSESFRVVSSHVSWGSFASDGSLGYDGGCCSGPRCRADLRDCRLLSAHAPSKVVLESAEPLEVFGFLNASARFEPSNPVEFWADWNFVGDVTIPSTATSPTTLMPGRHELVVSCGRFESRHTLWAVRRAEASPAPSLTAVTIAAYPESHVPSVLRVLARSARKHGAKLHVCFVCERYESHSEMKARRLRQVIQSLATPHVMYVDGRDCILLDGLDHIDREFRSMRAPVVMAAEAECHPVRDGDWAARFPSHPSGCNWLNAGQFIGERQALVHTLGVIEELWERVRRPGRAGELRDLVRYRHFGDNDQLLWQVAWLNGLIELRPDYEGQIFRNVNTLDVRLGENRHFDLADGVVFKQSGRRPSALHFSNTTEQTCMHQWAGFFGAF
jgi:hypothetical protein